MVPNYPIANVAITSFIFIFAAHELHVTTARLTVFLVPSDWKDLLRNVLIFVAFMIVVALYSGAFSV